MKAALIFSPDGEKLPQGLERQARCHPGGRSTSEVARSVPAWPTRTQAKCSGEKLHLSAKKPAELSQVQ